MITFGFINWKALGGLLVQLTLIYAVLIYLNLHSGVGKCKVSMTPRVTKATFKGALCNNLLQFTCINHFFSGKM